MTLTDRIIPPAALHWGPLTRETHAWHIDHVRYHLTTIQRRNDQLLERLGELRQTIADLWANGTP